MNPLDRNKRRASRHVKHYKKADGTATDKVAVNGVVNNRDNPRSHQHGMSMTKVVDGNKVKAPAIPYEALREAGLIKTVTVKQVVKDDNGDVVYDENKFPITRDIVDEVHCRDYGWVTDTQAVTHNFVVKMKKRSKNFDTLWNYIRNNNLGWSIVGSPCQTRFSDEQVRKDGNRVVGKQYALIATESLRPIIANNKDETKNPLKFAANWAEDDEGNKLWAYASALYIKLYPKNHSPENIQKLHHELMRGITQTKDGNPMILPIDGVILGENARSGNGTPEHVKRRAQMKANKKPKTEPYRSRKILPHELPK